MKAGGQAGTQARREGRKAGAGREAGRCDSSRCAGLAEAGRHPPAPRRGPLARTAAAPRYPPAGSSRQAVAGRSVSGRQAGRQAGSAAAAAATASNE